MLNFIKQYKNKLYLRIQQQTCRTIVYVHFAYGADLLGVTETTELTKEIEQIRIMNHFVSLFPNTFVAAFVK